MVRASTPSASNELERGVDHVVTGDGGAPLTGRGRHGTMLQEHCYRASDASHSPRSSRGNRPMTDRYTVISADGHAGAEVHDVPRYLERAYHDEFDAWAAVVREPLRRPRGPTAYRNWDSDARRARARGRRRRRRGALPQHDPAVLPAGVARCARRRDAGELRAALGRPARAQPVARRLLRRDARAAAAGSRRSSCTTSTPRSPRSAGRRRRGSRGGVLLPGTPPGSGLPPLYAPDYEPIWAVCEELGMPMNHHTGSRGRPTTATTPRRR